MNAVLVMRGGARSRAGRRPLLRALPALAWLAAAPARAVAEIGTMREPTGPVLLRVTGRAAGRVTRGQSSASACFDLAMLKALPQDEFETFTPWQDRSQHFKGPSLLTVLCEAGSTAAARSAGAVLARGAAQVEAALPWSDVLEHRPLVAWSVDGSQPSLRQRGPLQLVFPYDSAARLRTPAYRARTVWQLEEIVV